MGKGAESQWYDAIEEIQKRIVRILTPQGAGTGFIVSLSKTTSLCGVATAAHVVHYAHYWEQPIRIEHQASNKTLLLQRDSRAILVQPENDTASITFERQDLIIPETSPFIAPKERYFKPGVEIGWLGYPAIPKADLCFFAGHVSAWIESESAYLVDGVAINGVSGGPAFVLPLTIAGIVSAYIPNRATGESLPGLVLIRDVEQCHTLIEHFDSFDEAKAAETPPSGAPPIRPEGKNSAHGPSSS